MHGVQPARRQLAVRPAGVRPAGRRWPPPSTRDGRRRPADGRPTTQVDAAPRGAGARSSGEGGENPYTIQHDLQQTMHDLVGIIRTEAELKQALERIAALKERVAEPVGRGAPAVQPRLAPGARPAAHADRVASASPGRRSSAQESRGGHTRDDYPERRPGVGQGQPGRRAAGDGERVRCSREPLPADARRARRRSSRRRPVHDQLRRQRFRVWRGDADRRRAARTTPSRSTRARSCSTSSTGCRPPRPATSPSAGTARPASAARAAPRSTAGRG